MCHVSQDYQDYNEIVRGGAIFGSLFIVLLGLGENLVEVQGDLN
jgi:hypothetical protein